MTIKRLIAILNWKGANKEFKVITVRIDASFVAVQQEVAYFSSESLNNSYESLNKKWKSVAVEQFHSVSVKEYYLYFDELVVGIRLFIGDISNVSGLVLDPKIETFY